MLKKFGNIIVMLIVKYLPYCRKHKYCHRCKMECVCYTLLGRKYLIGREGK